jgi:putative transcriptional regulator
MSVGANIRKLREETGISQAELSRRIGVSQAMLCQVERETKNPSLQIGYAIAKELNCRIEDLL